MKKLFLILLSWFAFICVACVEKETEIVIISTNDMHAQLKNFSKLATFVKQQKAKYPNVLVVDAGDRFSGNAYVDGVEDRGKPMFDIMNAIGYDIATLGNHEFDYGQKVLRTRIDGANFPVICANINSDSSVFGSVDPYKILEIGGKKLCFLGFIQTERQNQLPAANPCNFEKISFTYYPKKISQYVSLRDSCDVFIGLTHLGADVDSVLATKMPQLDVIIGGHSHTLIDTTCLVNNVLVTQSGAGQKYAGVTKLRMKGNVVTDKSFSVVMLDTIASDSAVGAMVDGFMNIPELKEVLGETDGIFGKENVAALATDAMREAAKCDFVFYNKGGIRINEIPAGNITKELVLRIEPFSNYIVKRVMTLGELEEFLKMTYNYSAPKNRHIELFMSAGTYKIYCHKKDAQKVVFTDDKGRVLTDKNQKLMVGFSNYVTNSYEFPASCAPGEDTDIMITDAIAQYLKANKKINYNVKRQFVVE